MNVLAFRKYALMYLEARRDYICNLVSSDLERIITTCMEKKNKKTNVAK